MPTPSYQDLLERLADLPHARDFTSARDLPELTLADLGTILTHAPLLFLEALADTDPDLAALCADRLDNIRKPSEVYAHVGLIIVGAIRAYVKPLVLRDVQALLERNREADAIEDLGSHFPKTDEARELMTELGLGRLS